MQKKSWFNPKKEQIESWIESNFPDYKTRNSKKRGLIYLVDNPTIPGDSGYHIGISAEQGWVNDYRPQYRLKCSFIKFVSIVNNSSYHDAIKEICGKDTDIKAIFRKFNIKEDESAVNEIEEQKFEMPSGLTLLSKGDKDSMMYKMALGYLNKRQVSLEEAISSKVMYGVDQICFPYIEFDEIVYYQIRQISQKRFEFPDEAETGRAKTDYVWGFDNIEPYSRLYVFESIYNSYMVYPFGIAMGGATLDGRQLKKIKALNPSEIVLCGDRDMAGISGIIKNYNVLRKDFRNIFYCVPPKSLKNEPIDDFNKMGKVANRLNNKDVVIDYIDEAMVKLDMMQIIKLKKMEAKFNQLKKGDFKL